MEQVLDIWQCLECLQRLTFVTAFKVSLVGKQKWICYESVCFHDRFRTLASHWHPKLIVLIGLFTRKLQSELFM